MNNNRVWRAITSKNELDKTLSPIDMYKALEYYYHNNGVYTQLMQDLMENQIWTEGMLGLRNPAHRVVEFYVTKLFGTDMPIVAKNSLVADAIQQIWTWSNWKSKQQVFTRWLALFGDGFLKVASGAGKVFFQNIKPEYVTDLDEDERNYVTFIRFDIPKTRRLPDGKKEQYFFTEVWDKNLQTYRVWEQKKGTQVSLEQLGAPKAEKPFSAFGIDFIPIVHAKFKDIGEVRGLGAFTQCLDKIDEADRMATRLHEILYRFNDVLFVACANDNDPTGRPLPGPKIGGLDSTTNGESEALKIGSKTKIASLPGKSTLESLVPDLKYDAALSILNAMMDELEADLPEMTYYRLRQQGDQLSGKAIRYMLSGAIDKVLEARKNAEDALVRADQIALTLAKGQGVFPETIGSYENGDFEHSFAKRPVIQDSEMEVIEEIAAEVAATIPLTTSLRRHGWTEEEIAQMEQDKRKERLDSQNTAGQSMLEALRNFDQNNQE